MVLYMRPACRYCVRVLEVANERGVVFELRNIANPEHARALKERGGKQQVPYLVDEERGVEMYESEDIARYLAMNFSGS
jgi:glutaredoxin